MRSRSECDVFGFAFSFIGGSAISSRSRLSSSSGTSQKLRRSSLGALRDDSLLSLAGAPCGGTSVFCIVSAPAFPSVFLSCSLRFVLFLSFEAPLPRFTYPEALLSSLARSLKSVKRSAASKPAPLGRKHGKQFCDSPPSTVFLLRCNTSVV
eukprot:02703_5